MAVTRIKNSGIKTGVLKYDSALGGYPPLMPAPTATAGTESATVAFTAISGITTYRAISTPGSITATSATSPITVTGLTGGTSYTFQIRGENTAGNGAYSAASNSVTPTVPTSFESIATSTPSGVNTITFSSIPGTYKHLQVRISAIGAAGSNSFLRVNGATTGYSNHRLYGDGTTAAGNSLGGSDVFFAGNETTSLSTTLPTVMIIDIHDYASTTRTKSLKALFGTDRNGSGEVTLNGGLYNSTSAITSITFLTGSGNFSTGTSIALYGIKG